VAAYGPEEFWPDEQLKTAFVRYWMTRLSERAEKEALDLETWHVREMVNVEHYQRFVAAFSKNELVSLEMKDRIFETEYACEIQFSLIIKNPGGETKKYYFKDPWAKVNGEWLHLFLNKVLFPEIS
ncbi:MAG: hypothetical protein GY859_06090, partial [Desulfobacterales bacterium]|nr:hypothetical protein [Desulfobacterales bacterium]